MKIITILLLMVSTQILAEERGYQAIQDENKACVYSANVSKRTIKKINKSAQMNNKSLTMATYMFCFCQICQKAVLFKYKID